MSKKEYASAIIEDLKQVGTLEVKLYRALFISKGFPQVNNTTN